LCDDCQSTYITKFGKERKKELSQKFFLLSFLTCSQIWLSPVVDYRQHKIGKRKKKKKTKKKWPKILKLSTLI
jgi:hypothetical protein